MHGVEENFIKKCTLKVEQRNFINKIVTSKKKNLFKALRKGYRGCRSGSSSLSSSGEMS